MGAHFDCHDRNSALKRVPQMGAFFSTFVFVRFMESSFWHIFLYLHIHAPLRAPLDTLQPQPYPTLQLWPEPEPPPGDRPTSRVR